MSTDTSDGRRAFVLGLDGVSWERLVSLADDGALPNVARLIEEGAAGPLRSTVPSTTPLAWPSIATGVWPDGHGVYGFRSVTESYGHRANTGRDVASPELWELLSPSVVGNVPMTYPAETDDGAMVAGMMAPSIDAEGFASPPGLATEIRNELPAYHIGLEWGEFVDREEAFVSELSVLVDARRALLGRLMERDDWRLFFFVFTAPDRLQHLVADPGIIRDHFRTLDRVVGDVMAYVAERDADLYVVSDHGFGPLETLVYVNRVLETGGLLERRDPDGTRGTLADLGLTKDAVRETLDGMGLDPSGLARHLPDAVVETVAERVPGQHGLYDVDFARTRAFVHGTGMLYVNDAERFAEGPVEPAAIPAVKREARRLLEGLRDPETGESVLSVRDGDELFARDDDSPDLVIDVEPGYEARTSLADRQFEPAPTAGNHRPDGIFFAWGDQIAPGARPEGASVVDVAPTLLHGVGVAVPEHVDGQVLDVFAAGSPPAEQSVQTTSYETEAAPADSVGDLDAVEERLRGLGYVE